MAVYLPSAKVQADNLLVSPVVGADKSVQFIYENPDAQEVLVAGSFTDWQNGAIPMEIDENGIWSLHVEELAANVYQYKFIVDNEWITDPANKEIADGNSQLIVPGINLDILPAKVEKNKSYPLEATIVHENGTIQKVSQLTWKLKDNVDGIEIVDGNLMIHENANENSAFTIIAENYEDKVEKTIEIVGDMYTYNINYYRLDENYENWNLWIYNSGLPEAGFSFTNEQNDSYKFITGAFSFPENSITIIPRKGNWEAQDTENTITIKNGKQSTEAWIIEGLNKVFYSKEEAIKAIENLNNDTYERRHIQFMYDREDQDYTGWNIWVWGTGVKDDQIDFDNTLNGMATAKIHVNDVTQSVGFILRKGEDWDTAIKEGSGDRYIPINKNDLITKAYVTSGQEELYIVPEVNGPVLSDGNAIFYYRDKQLYANNEMDKIDSVELKFNDKRYKMEKESKNERFSYTVENIPEGNFPYSFIVTIDGVQAEVADPYNTQDGQIFMN